MTFDCTMTCRHVVCTGLRTSVTCTHTSTYVFPHLPLLLHSLRSHTSQRKDVVSALHATETPSEWTECRGKIDQNFNTKHSNSSVTLLPKVLERIPVMLFVGDQDMICNYVGVENLIASLKWNGETGLGVSVLFSNTG